MNMPPLSKHFTRLIRLIKFNRGRKRSIKRVGLHRCREAEKIRISFPATTSLNLTMKTLELDGEGLRDRREGRLHSSDRANQAKKDGIVSFKCWSTLREKKTGQLKEVK